jgi:NDP-hexose 4-ketoreductase
VRALVVGASGFLGTHVVRQLHDDGLDVVTAGRGPSAGASRQVRLDIVIDPVERIARVLRDVEADVLINCAGATSGPIEALVDANVTGTYQLLCAWADAGSRGRVVHVGSAAEYGRTPWGSSVAETDTARPVSPYGATKLAGTRLCELARRGGADVVVLRVFNPLGMGAPSSGLPGRLLAEVRRSLIDGEPICLGPCSDVRDFVDARDVARCVAAASVAPVLAVPVLNVGTGEGRQVRSLVEGLVALSGTASEVVETDEGSSRSAGAPWQQADVALAAAELGWKAEHDLASSLRAWWEATS